MTVVLGIDPGGKSCGLVVRDGSTCLAHAVVTNPGTATGIPERSYFDAVATKAWWMFREFQPQTVAMESVVPPRWHMGGKKSPMHPGSLIGVSAVAGYLMATFPDVVLIPPGGNGSALLRTYPPELIGARESAKGTGILRHARSAWDVAGAAHNYRVREIA